MRKELKEAASIIKKAASIIPLFFGTTLITMSFLTSLLSTGVRRKLFLDLLFLGNDLFHLELPMDEYIRAEILRFSAFHFLKL